MSIAGLTNITGHFYNTTNACGENPADNDTDLVFMRQMKLPRTISAAIYLTLIPFILVGNLLVIISVRVFRRLQEVSNYLLASLAVSDLIVGLFVIPGYAALFFIPGKLRCSYTACVLIKGVGILGLNSTFVHLLVIALDRTFTIHSPFRYAQWRTPRKVFVGIAGVWVYVIVVTLLLFFGFKNAASLHGKHCNRNLFPRWYMSLFGITMLTCILVPGLLYLRLFYVASKLKSY